MNEKKGLLDRFREWWESGYEHDEGYLVEKSAKSRPNLSLKERIHLWWLKGYDDPELVERYLPSRSTVNETVERTPSTVEHAKRPKKLLEEQSSGAKATGRTSKTLTQNHALSSQAPSKEDLNVLKKCLGIIKGFLCFKHRGRGVYLVTYDPETKRKIWKLLGSWEHLKRESELKEKSD